MKKADSCSDYSFALDFFLKRFQICLQQYLFVYRMVIELLLAEDLLVKDQQVFDFLNEYDGLIARKAQERKKRRKARRE